MLKRRRTLEEQPATELVEEAFHLLRQTPGAALAAYFLGSLPFVLALLYFWSDMARSAFAGDHLLTGSLAVTLLFFWMKLWHAVFAQELLAHLAREPAPRWRPRWLLRAGLHQAIVQPLGLLVLPVSLPLVLALGWTYAFFANATAMAAGPAPDIKSLVSRSWRQMKLWPMQSQGVMFMFKLLALFVAINLALVLFGLPFLARTLLGVESVVTRAPWAAANSTALAAVVALTWLCLDPVLKAVYVLRCFHGESLQTGQDLRAELKGYAVPTRALALVLLLPALLAGVIPSLHAADPAPPANSKPVSSIPLTPGALDRSIDQVIRQREYSWRLPRDADAGRKPASDGFSRSLESFFKSLESGVKAVGRWIRDFIDWLTKQSLSPKTGGTGGFNPATAIRGLVIVLLVALLGVLVWLFFRLWRHRGSTAEVAAEALAPVPDVADENVGADQLPEDGWVTLARDLLERGELRLALRALYLASLAALAGRNLITLARFKSNRDYERELARRGHALAELPGLFSENVAVFERVWYGLHEVTPELLREFSGKVERLKAGA